MLALKPRDRNQVEKQHQENRKKARKRTLYNLMRHYKQLRYIQKEMADVLYVI